MCLEGWSTAVFEPAAARLGFIFRLGPGRLGAPVPEEPIKTFLLSSRVTSRPLARLDRSFD